VLASFLLASISLRLLSRVITFHELKDSYPHHDAEARALPLYPPVRVRKVSLKVSTATSTPTKHQQTLNLDFTESTLAQHVATTVNWKLSDEHDANEVSGDISLTQ
jgi:hypothetical protein